MKSRYPHHIAPHHYDRRSFLWRLGGGLGGIALAEMLGREGLLAAGMGKPEFNGGIHFPAKASRQEIMNTLPVQRACLLESTGPQTQWLVEGLWSEQAVGILGGEPKCCKSFLALDVAVSVASACQDRVSHRPRRGRHPPAAYRVG